MQITVLGSGCKNCKTLLDYVQKADKELNLCANIVYQTDMLEIVKTGIMSTPGLMVDGKIISSGKLPNYEAIKLMLKSQL